ncbi:MAG: hypothetical protein ACLQUY_15420, partial [Ktedonobacterales bacterium]
MGHRSASTTLPRTPPCLRHPAHAPNAGAVPPPGGFAPHPEPRPPSSFRQPTQSAKFEHDHGRPLISALVVQAGTHQAGDGFYKALLQKRLDIQLPPDQERAFWREEIRKVVTYWNAAPGEEEPDTQARVLALISRIESDLKEVRTLISIG